MGVWFKQENDTVMIHIYVQPGAKCTEIVGFYGDVPKIRLASLPIDGRANDALLSFVAQLFDVPRRQVMLIRGTKSRHKQVVITGSIVKPQCIVKLDE